MAATHQLKVQDIFSVKDFVCVVTGGGTGIGLMCSQALAANGVGLPIYTVLRRLRFNNDCEDAGESVYHRATHRGARKRSEAAHTTGWW